MVVQEVRFREAAEVGSAGALVPTGDTVAMLALSERWMSMARREMRAHVWGIFGGMVGSVVLMVLITVGKRAAGWYRKLATCHRLVRKALSQPPESRVSAVGLDNEPPDAPPTPTDSAPPSLDGHRHSFGSGERQAVGFSAPQCHPSTERVPAMGNGWMEP